MSKRKGVMPTFSELMEDLKPMTFREKVDHIWTYYKEYMFLIAIAIALLVGITSMAINGNQDIIAMGVLANASITVEGKAYLETGYFEKVGGTKGQAVKLYTTNFQSLEDPLSSEDNYNATQLLTNQVSAGQLDYAIIDEFALSFYLGQCVFADLRELFSEQQLEELAQKDMLVYLTEGDVDEEGNLIPGTGDIEGRYPVAIKMKDTAFGQEALYGKTYYFAVGGNNPSKEHVLGVWEHILDWENREPVSAKGQGEEK